MTIKQIECEYNEPIDKVLSYFLGQDYMGCSMLRPYQVANLFRKSVGDINNLIKKYHIHLDKSLHFPTPTEDKCWVKFGVSLRYYITTRSKFMTEKEIAIELGVSRQEIGKLIKQHKIHKQRLLRCLYERGGY